MIEILVGSIIIFIFIRKYFWHYYWKKQQRKYLPNPSEKIYIDANGYFRMKSTHRLIHRDVAYKYHYLPNLRFYPKPFKDYVVHHRDENKLHNDPANLVILEPDQHNRLHRFP